MLVEKIPSFETYRIGTRPAVLTSLRRMLDYFDINIDQKIYFNGESEVSKLMGGEGTNKRGTDIVTDLNYDNKLFVELDVEAADYNDALDAYTGNGSVPAFWYDPITKTRLAPKFITKRFSVTVTAHLRDRMTGERFLTFLKSRTLGTHQNTEFTVETHYPLSTSAMQCFKEIFDRQVSGGVLPADKNFIDWMMENATVPTGILRNAAYNNPVFVFMQSIINVGANIDNPVSRLVTKGSHVGKYEVSFTYWFYWAEHSEWVINYPIQVCQQPMPQEYLPSPREFNIQQEPPRRFFEAAASYLVWDYDKYKAPYYHIFPNIDNWRPPTTYWLNPQLQVMVGVENKPEQILLNMKEIAGFTWNPVVLDYILKYHDKVTRRHHCPMNIKVYSEDIEVLETQIELRENGDLVLKRLPRMENTYRIVFSFDYALRLYDQDALDDMLNDPDYGKWIIGILFPQYPLPDDWPANGIDSWWDIHNDIEVGDGDPVDFWLPYGMMGFLIIAHNTDTYELYKTLIDKGAINGADYYRANPGTS